MSVQETLPQIDLHGGQQTERENVTSEFAKARTLAVDLLVNHALVTPGSPRNIIFSGFDVDAHIFPVGTQYSVKGTIDSDGESESNTSFSVAAFTYRRHKNLKEVDIIELIKEGNLDVLVLRKDGGYVLERDADKKDTVRKRAASLSEVRTWKTDLEAFSERVNNDPDSLSDEPAVRFDSFGSRVI